MKVRTPLLDGVFDARLVERPSSVARGEHEVVLEIDAGAPIQVSPPDGSGCVVVEASDAEWDALRTAGFELARDEPTPRSSSGLLARFGAALNRASVRFVPDPFVLALILTLLVLGFGLALAPLDTVLVGWVEGFASPGGLAFALQMCLVLVTGHALATSPPVQRLVSRLAELRWGAAGSAALVAFVACVAAVVHWGLGAIMGAFLAREIARNAQTRGVRLHYPLLGGAAYAGLAVWHGGLSGSAPLKVAEEGHFAADHVGVIPVEATLFAPLNLIVTSTLCVLIPLAFYLMTPPEAARVGPSNLPPSTDDETRVVEGASRLGELAPIGRVVGLLGLGGILAGWIMGELRLDLNLVNLMFLFAGILAQAKLRRYVDAVADGARGAGAIVLQFPFYFGILGVMQVSGMIESISHAMVRVASPETFPVLAFGSAGLVNLCVPSGGGQWAVQGEILLEAAHQLGVDPATVVMAFSYGDAWTNMLQPFWALPLLGIMGLEAKDIIGYTGVVCVLMGVVVPVLLLVLG